MASKCGFQMDHNISIWSSPNLTSGSWSYVGNAIDVADRPAGILKLPIFNNIIPLSSKVLFFVHILYTTRILNYMSLYGTICDGIYLVYMQLR